MHDLIRRAEALHADETDADLLWAEIHRLRAAVQGPDGYTTWQEAATAERVRRVAAENALKAQQPREPVSAEAARLGLQFCCGNSERLHDEIGKLRNVVQRGMIAKCPAVFEAWNYHFPDDQREVPEAAKHVATVAEVHMSRYTIEWVNGPLPEGTRLYAQPAPVDAEGLPPLPEPVGVLHRGNGGEWWFSCGDNLRNLYAQPMGEHNLYTSDQLRRAQREAMARGAEIAAIAIRQGAKT